MVSSSPPRRRRPPFIVDRTTLRLLLIPEPLIVLTYLLGTHARVLQPSLAPPLIIAALPLAAAIVAFRGLRTLPYSRRRNLAVLGISLVELVSVALAVATLGAHAQRRAGRNEPIKAITAFQHAELRDSLPGVGGRGGTRR